MTDSVAKKITDALAALLATITGVGDVEINAPLPEEIPEGGLIIVREGKVEESEEVLGGFDAAYVIQIFPVEVYVSAGGDDDRETNYDTIVAAIGAKLYADRTLGGVSKWLIAQRPEPVAQAILGAAPVKAATIDVTVHYESDNPLG